MSDSHDADSLERLHQVIQAQGDLIEELRNRTLLYLDVLLDIGFDPDELAAA